MIQKGKHFWQRIRDSKSLINLSSLLTGNIVAVLIPVLISPLLTRLFTESDFGLLTLFNSILTIALSFSTGRLDFAILEAKTKSIASHLFFLSISFAFFSSLLVLIIGLLIIPYIESVEAGLLWSLIGIIAGMIFINALTQSFRYLLNREDAYKELALVKVIRSIFTGSFQLIGGFLNPQSLTLIIGKVLGDIVTLLVSIWIVTKKRLIEVKLSRYKLRYVLEKFSKYYRVNSFHALISTLSTNFLPLLFAVLFTIEETGYYGLSYRVGILPVTVISQAVFQFFSREFAKKVESDRSSKSMFKRMTMGLFSISIFPFLLLILFGPELFGFVFGENWSESGRYAQILAPYLLMVFIVSPFTFVPIRLDRHVKSFSIEIVNTVSRITVLLIGAQFSVYVALALYSLVGFLTQGYLMLWIYSLIKKNDVSL